MTLNEIDRAMSISLPCFYTGRHGSDYPIVGTVSALIKRRARDNSVLWQVEFKCDRGNSVLICSPDDIKPVFE